MDFASSSGPWSDLKGMVEGVEGKVSRAESCRLSRMFGGEAVAVDGCLSYIKQSGLPGPLDSNPREIYTWQRYEEPAYLKMEDPPAHVLGCGVRVALSSPDVRPGFNVWHGVKPAAAGSLARHSILMMPNVHTDVGGTNGWIYPLLKGKLLRNVNPVNHMLGDRRAVVGRLAVEMAAADVHYTKFAVDEGRILRVPFISIVIVGGTREYAAERKCIWRESVEGVDSTRTIIFCNKVTNYPKEFIHLFSESVYSEQFVQVVVRRVRPMSSFKPYLIKKAVSGERLDGCAFVYAASNVAHNARDSWRQYLASGVEYITLPLHYKHARYDDHSYDSTEFDGCNKFLPYELCRFMSRDSIFHLATPQSCEVVGDHVYIAKRPFWNMENTTNWLVKFGAWLKRKQLSMFKRDLMIIRAKITYDFINSVVKLDGGRPGQEALIYVSYRSLMLPVDTSGHLINWLVVSESGLVSNRNVDHWNECLDVDIWEGGSMYHNLLDMACAVRVYQHFSVGGEPNGANLKISVRLALGELFIRIARYSGAYRYNPWSGGRRSEVRRLSGKATMSSFAIGQIGLSVAGSLALLSDVDRKHVGESVDDLGGGVYKLEELGDCYFCSEYVVGSGLGCFSYRVGEDECIDASEIRMRVNYLRGLGSRRD
jgi:hypothetical protein